MKGLEIANKKAKEASEKEKNKKPSIVIAIGSKEDKDEKTCPHCGEVISEDSEEKSE